MTSCDGQGLFYEPKLYHKDHIYKELDLSRVNGHAYSNCLGLQTAAHKPLKQNIQDKNQRDADLMLRLAAIFI